MSGIDSHCHIQTKDYPLDANQAYQNAKQAGLEGLIVVGENFEDSLRAIEFAKDKDDVFATAGVHPHEVASKFQDLEKLAELTTKKIVAIGECGLDYWYMHSPKEQQREALARQVALAQENDLPLIFHVRGSREAPDDIFNEFLILIDEANNRGEKIRGVVHSFTGGQKACEGVLSRGLIVGVNGILTFTKDESLITAVKNLPREKYVLETDSPYLTPTPKRGKVNEPKNLVLIAEALAELRGEAVEDIMSYTAQNAKKLFKLKF